MKVSICIPAYKHPDFLKRCIDSVLTQDFSDYELIITDDSPDNTLQTLVNAYNDVRIRYIKNEKPLGSPENWNKGLSLAKGQYIKILHHDDWFPTPHCLSRFVALLDNNPEADIAFAASCDIDADKRQKIHIADKLFLDSLTKQPENLYLHNRLGAPSTCIFKNNKDYYFDINLKWLVDIDFYIRIIKATPFVFSSEILVNIGISEFQITQLCTADNNIRIVEKLYLFEKFRLNEKELKYRLSLAKTLGQNGIYTSSELRRRLPNCKFRLSNNDSIVAFFYYIKRKVRTVCLR